MDEEFAERMRLLRVAYGLTIGISELSQLRWAQIVGMSATGWNNCEARGARLGLDRALTICAKTGASLDFIYRGDRSALPPKLQLALIEAEQIK